MLIDVEEALNLRALFLGKQGCCHSQSLCSFLEEKGFKLEKHLFIDRLHDFPTRLLDWRGDYIFSFRCPVKIPEQVIQNASKAAINFHPAPPNYRGSGAVNWALYNNDKEFGSTAHLITKEIDSGTIIQCVRFSIEPSDNLQTLWERSYDVTYDMAYEMIANISSGGMKYIEGLIEKNTQERWQGENRRISEINQLENIALDCSAEELNRVIRATVFGKFGPKINFHGYEFKLLQRDK